MRYLNLAITATAGGIIKFTAAIQKYHTPQSIKKNLYTEIADWYCKWMNKKSN